MRRTCIVKLPAILLCLGLTTVCGGVCGAEPKTLLLLGQKPDGHPPGTHEYMPGQRILRHLLRGVPGLKVEVVQADGEWPEGPELLAKADGVVLFVSEGGRWVMEDSRRHEALSRLAQRGGGLSGLHWGLGTKEAANIDAYVRLLGACHGGPDRKFRVLKNVGLAIAGEHPVQTGLQSLDVDEEFYFALKRAPANTGKITPLATIEVDGTREMVGWAFDRADGGRSFGFTGLHYHQNWQRPEYRRFVAQGVLWTMDLPVPEGGLNVDLPPELLP